VHHESGARLSPQNLLRHVQKGAFMCTWPARRRGSSSLHWGTWGRS